MYFTKLTTAANTKNEKTGIKNIKNKNGFQDYRDRRGDLDNGELYCIYLHHLQFFYFNIQSAFKITFLKYVLIFIMQIIKITKVRLRVYIAIFNNIIIVL